MLHRTKAFNVVALAEFLTVVWEKYFQHKILDHAHSRVSGHRLLYERLLKRMPDCIKEVKCVGDGEYLVPSAREDRLYNVCTKVGLCTCRTGQQGAFCKHQTLVHKLHGGEFPNAPVLSKGGRHELDKLALGEKCPSIEFFEGLHERGAQPADTALCIDTAEDCLDGQEATSSSTQHELPRSSEGLAAQLVSQVSVSRKF